MVTDFSPRPLVHRIVAALGGRRACADITNSLEDSVRAWDHKGVPYRYFDALTKAARQRGVGWISAEVLLATRPQRTWPTKPPPPPRKRIRRKQAAPATDDQRVA